MTVMKNSKTAMLINKYLISSAAISFPSFLLNRHWTSQAKVQSSKDPSLLNSQPVDSEQGLYQVAYVCWYGSKIKKAVYTSCQDIGYEDLSTSLKLTTCFATVQLHPFGPLCPSTSCLCRWDILQISILQTQNNKKYLSLSRPMGPEVQKSVKPTETSTLLWVCLFTIAVLTVLRRCVHPVVCTHHTPLQTE